MKQNKLIVQETLNSIRQHEKEDFISLTDIAKAKNADELTKEEEEILKSKFSTSSWGGRRKAIKVFTEQGVYMLATILKSDIATEVTVAIMRAFVKMRHFALTYEDIVNKLNNLDVKVTNHDETLQKVISALSDLIHDTKENETKRIGFINK